MGPVATQYAVGAALLVGALVVVGLLALTLVALAGSRRRRRSLMAELQTSRAEMEALRQRLDELAQEVTDRRRAAAVTGQEYVITSLAGTRTGRAGPSVGLSAEPLPPARPGPPLAAMLQDRLVGVLARRGSSPAAGPLVDTVVRAVSFGHGVRRALSPDNLDRAVAEAQLARRRSRRRRRSELREVRRLYRAAGPLP